MSGNLINLFMWGYQQHALLSFQVQAEQLFRKIDSQFDPKVFFIGVLVDEREDRHPICLEPEDCGFSVENFKDLKQLVEALEKADSDNNIFHSHQIAQDNHNQRITSRSYIEAIKKILIRSDLFGDDDYFVSSPMYVEGFQVFTVLCLQKKNIQKYYSLTKDKVDRLTVYRSFIESSIYVFLKECSNALKDPTTSLDGFDRRSEELLRLSGRQLMYTVSGAGRNFEGLHHLYDACNEIASMKYEGGIGLGRLIIAARVHKNVKLTLQLENPIRISDYRKVRKFLEIADDNSSLVSDSAYIYGLGELRGKYNPMEESIFVVNFTNHFKWELFHDNNPLMEIENREPNLSREKINREKFYVDFSRVFHDIHREQIDDLWDLTLEAIKQSHGTMLVISDDAITEAIRLGGQSFPVKPLKLSDKIIRQITSIDGAVLLDRNSNCHAIGVILDGLATDKGDSSRGARYNSAIRYYEQFGKSGGLMLVIISEDGMINLIPDLRPQISKIRISGDVSDFADFLDAKELDHKNFNRGMAYFKSISFYLTDEECNSINQTRRAIEEKFKSDLVNMKIIYEDLYPNPEMNESYYIGYRKSDK